MRPNAEALAVAEVELRDAQAALQLDNENNANRRRYSLALEANRAAEASARRLLAGLSQTAC